MSPELQALQDADFGWVRSRDSVWSDEAPDAGPNEDLAAAIVAELCISADDDPAKVIDHEVSADLHLAGQLNPGDDLDEFEQQFVDEREQLPKDRWLDAVAPAAEPIDHHHPETLGAAIAVMCAEIFTDVVEH